MKRTHGQDGLPAWIIQIPKVLQPATLVLEPESKELRMSKYRLYKAVLLQMALGTIIGVCLSLNPTLLSVLPFTQRHMISYPSPCSVFFL